MTHFFRSITCLFASNSITFSLVSHFTLIMAKNLPWLYEKNADGTNKLIGPGEKCVIPTDKCSWKNRESMKSSGVKTRSQTMQ